MSCRSLREITWQSTHVDARKLTTAFGRAEICLKLEPNASPSTKNVKTEDALSLNSDQNYISLCIDQSAINLGSEWNNGQDIIRGEFSWILTTSFNYYYKKCMGIRKENLPKHISPFLPSCLVWFIGSMRDWLITIWTKKQMNHWWLLDWRLLRWWHC